ncbi:MAG TPA: hypothetical protein VF695_01500 [Sphingomonas sp.]|jgi:hypothetical protein
MRRRTKRDGTREGPGPRGLFTAAILVVLGLLVAWLCLRFALVRALPPSAPAVSRVVPNDAGVTLAKATEALVRQRGLLSPADLDAVRRAATAAPLDARAFLILGHQQLLDAQPQRAVKTLEAGQRLDPRQRLIHLLLLDRYLRTARYAESATQFAVLARLMGGTQAPIAAAMAQMALAPETRDAVRRTLATDAMLERRVLVALARSDTDPAPIFALASARARAEAGNKDSWGPVLVSRLVERDRYAAARAVWQRVHRLPDAAVATPIFDARLAKSPASPPFNWTLASGSLGAADIRAGGLAVDYYGRESGDLASQLLVLRPGRYRFAVTVEPGKTDAASKLIWTIACAGNGQTALMNMPVIAAVAKRRIAADFAVPPGCSAQSLTLRGEAGEFPVPIVVTLRDPTIQPVGPRP